MKCIKILKERYENIENFFVKKSIKVIIVALGAFLVSNVVFIFLPEWAVITDDELSSLANEVKKELFVESAEVSSMYEESELIFTLENYSYRIPFKDRNIKNTGYGNFEYSTKNPEIFLDVTWETNHVGDIKIISIEEVIK